MVAVCASSLAVWLLTHAASAQSLAGTVPLGVALRWADVSMPSPRWRFDDPDLLRPGVPVAISEALAEGATVTVAASVDLDRDGRDEVLLQVAPRADPSPENTHPGLVLLHRTAGAWRARVLARGAPWYDPGDIYVTAPATPFGWSVVQDGARRRLVIGYVTPITGENLSGHGHNAWNHYAALRIELIAGEPRVDGFCARNDYPTEGNHNVWRSSRIACFNGGYRPLPLDACAWLRVDGWWEGGDSSTWSNPPDAITAAWCRAFARGPRHPL